MDGWRASTTQRFQPVLARWDGRSWHPVAVHVPNGADLLYGITPDGHGGLWIEAEGSSSGQWWMLHRSASGAWTSTALPSHAWLGQAALVPGTSSLWGAGAVPVVGGSDAEIWAYGPVGAAAGGR